MKLREGSRNSPVYIETSSVSSSSESKGADYFSRLSSYKKLYGKDTKPGDFSRTRDLAGERTLASTLMMGDQDDSRLGKLNPTSVQRKHHSRQPSMKVSLESLTIVEEENSAQAEVLTTQSQS